MRVGQVGFGVIAIIQACSEEMGASAVGDVIDDLKLTCPASRVSLVEQDDNMTWKPLAIRAGYIKLGLMHKY